MESWLGSCSYFKIDEMADIREEEGKIIIERMRDNSLDELLAGITEENLHKEVSFGSSEGNEEF